MYKVLWSYENTKTRFSQNRSPVTYGVFAYDGRVGPIKIFHITKNYLG